jgi:hypothetical protein
MPDLFIIGAGASVPYGFPDGKELFDNLRNLNYDFKNRNFPGNFIKDDFNTLYKNSHKDPEYTMKIMNEFSHVIKKSTMISIDDFLRNRKDIDHNQLDFGKRIIAKNILEAEGISQIKNKIDWLNHLFSLIDRDENRFKKFFNSKFIIFNYDRLFEQKVFEYLFYDKRHIEEVWEELERMEIIHIHGYLGSLKDVAFGNSENEHYCSIVENMKTIWEKNNKDKIKIQRYFSKCNRIFFLGFGWLEDNMRLLDLDNKEKKILRGKEIYGTAFGMSENKIKNLEDRLKFCGALQPNIKNCEVVNLIKDFFY